jgi:hypothetical protein
VAEHPGVLIVRTDGVIDVPDAVPVVHGLVDAIERLLGSLGIPARDERDQQRTEET